METKAVIDADSEQVIERFNEADTDSVLDKYVSLGRWGDVSVDCDGDIVLWQDL